MKKLFLLTKDLVIMTLVLASTLYVSLKLFEQYAPVPLERRNTHGLTFSNCLGLSLFYTVSISVFLFIIGILIHKLININNYKSLIGLISSTAFIFLFKGSTGGLYFAHYITILEILIVVVFGVIVGKRVIKYLPT